MDRRRTLHIAFMAMALVSMTVPALAQYQVRVGIKPTSGRWQDTLLAGETNTLTVSITNPVPVASYVIPLLFKAQTYSAFAKASTGGDAAVTYVNRLATPGNPFTVRSVNVLGVNQISPDSILFGAVEFGSNYMPAGTGIVLEYPLTINPQVGSVRIDTAFLPPSNRLSFSLPDGSEINNVAFNSNPVFPVVLRTPNGGPVCNPATNITSHFGVLLSKVITATDPESNPLTFKQVCGPGSTTAAGTWTWTPGCAQVGTQQVCVTVSDLNHFDWDTCKFDVTVTQSPPTLSCTNQSVHYGDTLDFLINGSDDGCPSSIKFFKTSGPGTLNASTGRFVYTPLCADKGMKLVEVGVTDGHDTLRCEFTINVTNSAPVINCPANFSAGINDTVKFQLAASDPDGDPITCSLISFTKLSGPTGGGPNFPPTLSGGCLFTWPTSNASNDDDFGAWEVRLRVDEPCDSAFCTFEIEITPNRPPQCTAPGNVSVHWSAGTAAAQFTWFDPDGDSTTITQISGPGSTNASGLWTWSGFGCANRGVYEVCAVVADSAFPQGDTCCFRVTIVQDAPALHCRDTAVHTGSGPITMSFATTDDGCPGNPVRYHKISGRGSIDSITGLYTLISLTPDFACGDLGDYPVTIQATDGELTSTCDFIVRIYNHPPMFQCPMYDDTLEHVSNRVFTYNSQLSDPDGDAFTQVIVWSFTKLSGPAGGPTHAPTISSTGVVTWVTDPTTSADLGTWRMILQARDSCAQSRCSLLVSVVHNRPPYCLSGNSAGHQGDTARGAVLGIDLDKDPLTFRQLSGPGSFIVDEDVARWKWLTTCTDVGTYQVCFTVSDPVFHDADTCCFNVTIYETPPVVNCSTQYVHYGDTLRYDIPREDDACPQAATWTLLSGPGSIDAVTGRYTLPTECADVGTHPVTVRLYDGVRADTCTFDVHVTNTPPFAECPPDQMGLKVGVTVNLNIPFGDADGDPTNISLVLFQKLGGANFNPPNNAPTLSPAGVFNWVTNFNNLNDVATWLVEVRAKEFCDSALCSFRIEILPNEAPLCSGPSDYEGGCDTVHTQPFLATDEENNPITYTRIVGPGLVSAAGVWTWKPPCDSGGLYQVCVTVGDFLHPQADTCCFRFSVCAVSERGDVNGNGVANSEDIIMMVNFMFKGQQMPFGPYTADMNCDGVPNASDIITLVNYVFKSGAIPCNACTSPLYPGLP
jgi:hypothetical protein